MIECGRYNELELPVNQKKATSFYPPSVLMATLKADYLPTGRSQARAYLRPSTTTTIQSLPKRQYFHHLFSRQNAMDRSQLSYPRMRILIFATVVFAFVTHAAASCGFAADEAGFDRNSLVIGDEALLRSGKVIRGTIDADQAAESALSIRTFDGMHLKIERRLISKVKPLDAIAQRYNDLLAKMVDDAKSHADIVTWCEEQESGRLRFKRQILFHRQRLLKHAPDDKSTRKKLGYTYLKDEARWVLENQYWVSKGYFKQGTGWIPSLTAPAANGRNASTEKQPNRRLQFNFWKRNLNRSSRSQAIADLLKITDSSLMPVLYDAYSEEKDPAVRNVYMEVFASARPVSAIAIQGLVAAVIDHQSESALDYLKQDGFDRNRATVYLSRFLASKNNAKIQRAAFVIGELGTTNAILALSNALETKHIVSPGDGSRINGNFGNANGGNFNFGSKKAESRVFQNDAVLAALIKITDQDFGFSKQAYDKWYVENHTLQDFRARR